MDERRFAVRAQARRQRRSTYDACAGSARSGPVLAIMGQIRADPKPPWPLRSAGTSSAASSTTSATPASAGGSRGNSRTSTASRSRCGSTTSRHSRASRPRSCRTATTRRRRACACAGSPATSRPTRRCPTSSIEAFGCGLPDRYVAAMADCARPPVWVVLEYLSAEPWIDASHGLPSPHPRLPLTRWFWFPGFTPGSGGLLREAGLLAARDAFRADPAAARRRLAGRPVHARSGSPVRDALLLRQSGAARAARRVGGRRRARRVHRPGRRGAVGTRPLDRRRDAASRRAVHARPADAGRRAVRGPGRVRSPAVGRRPQLRPRRGLVRARAVGRAALRLAALPAGRRRAPRRRWTRS